MADLRDDYYPLKNRLVGIPPRIVWNGSCGSNNDGRVSMFKNLEPPLYKIMDKDNHYA